MKVSDTVICTKCLYHKSPAYSIKLTENCFVQNNIRNSSSLSRVGTNAVESTHFLTRKVLHMKATDKLENPFTHFPYSDTRNCHYVDRQIKQNNKKGFILKV